MTSHQAEAGITGVFFRLIDNSRKLLGQSKTATEAEISHLSSLIESEIIPRLQMTFPSPSTSNPADVPQVPDVPTQSNDYDVEGFVDALRSGNSDTAFPFIESLHRSDHSLLEIYRHLLAPAARRLGDMWDNDECSFADVTIAITKLRHMAIATAPLFPIHSFDDSGQAPRILITTVPGEQHTVGVHLAVEAFRSEGWSVWSGMPRTTTELVDLVAQEHYDVIGLSVTANRNISVLAEAIVDARRASINSGVKIVVGGGVTQAAPSRLETLNVDLIAGDLETTLARVAELVPRRSDARA